MLTYCEESIPTIRKDLISTSVKQVAINRLESAATKGQLEIIQWFLGTVGFDANFLPFSICREAAENGHLEVLKYLRRWKVPWDESVCSVAAEGDHLAVLQWYRQNGAPWDSSVVANAQSAELLRWALDHGVSIIGKKVVCKDY